MSTTAEQFRRADDIFRAAATLDPARREQFIIESSGGDARLLAQLRALLRADQLPQGVLDQPALGTSVSMATVQLTAGVAGTIPERIGDYRIVRVIGEGGMGIVYEAEQNEPRRRVALKVIRPGMMSASLLRRFRHEAQMLGKLQHPGIAQIYEAGTADQGEGGQPYFAMELVSGRPLLEYAEAHRLGTRQRLELMARICDAVHHAHLNGVIHRDLKPVNILVVDEGTEARRHEGAKGPLGAPALRTSLPPCLGAFPKILDFGIACATEADIQTVTIRTDVGHLLGTIAYMSPEQAAGDPAQLDIRSDVYALGVIAYELLAGRLPYNVHGKMMHEAVRVIREDEPSRLSSISRVFRGDVETIIAKALEKEKDRRYQSAAEFALDIRRYLSEQPIAARPASRLYQLRKFARRNKAIVTGVTVAFLALLVGTVASIWQAIEAHGAEVIAKRQAYRATISAAATAIDSHDPVTAGRRLNEIVESDRAWEWRFLSARLDQSKAIIVPPEPALAAAATSDGQIVMISASGFVRRYDPQSSREISNTQLDGLAPIRAAAFSADGSHVATASGDGGRNIHLCDLSGAVGSPRLIGTRDHTVNTLAISDDAHFVAIHVRGVVVVLNAAEGGEPVVSEPVSYAPKLSFCHDSNFLGAVQGDLIHLIDCRTGKLVRKLGVANGGGTIAFSPQDDRFVCGGAGKWVQISQTASGQSLRSMSGHTGTVTQLAWSADGNWIASAGVDSTLRVWNAGDGSQAAVWHMPKADCREIRFLPGALELMTLHADGKLRLWNARSDQGPDVLRGHESYVYAVTFTPDGSKIVSGSWDETIRIWDSRSGQSLSTIRGDHNYVSAIAVSPDGRLIASGHHRGGGRASKLRLWDARTGELVRDLPTAIGETTAVSFSPDGEWLACTRTHAATTLFDVRDPNVPPVSLADGKSQLPGKGADLFVQDVAWSHDGRWLATSYGNGSIRVWNARDKSLVRRMTGHRGASRNIAFSPDDRLLASASDDSTARLWDVASGTCLATLARHSDSVYAVAFSPDGTRLATGSRDTTIRIWDVSSHEEMLELRGHADYVYSLAFSPDGSTLISGSGDGTVRSWDAAPRHVDMDRSSG